ncbi:MAG TPA: RidA family protein [Dongiaceae bacterium]|jgi:enamine deaminase RidA (YjgF/YER057c/UK114 family)
MPRQLISSGSKFEAEACYSRAVLDGDFVFVSGTTGFDYSTMTISADVVEQTRQTFRNIEAALQKAGSSLKDAVRATYYIPDAADWPKIYSVFKEFLSESRPAATSIICGLVDPRMKIEIEITARKRS